MRQSQLFTKTKKEFAKDEESINSKLLMKAGFIDKLMAGVYTFLPLGLRVLNKIEKIIREEMDNVGGQEILMPALHPKEIWEKTKRWNMDVLFKTKGVGNKDYAFGPTHEEVVTPLLQKFILSYKDLPKSVYQIQSKFRDEARAKSGLLRGREFRMKDMYSFHTTEEGLNKYYDLAAQAYENVWKRLSLGDITLKTFASGGVFSKYSHEYQTVCETGEDTIFHVANKDLTFNKEIAPSKAPVFDNSDEVEKPMEDIKGEGLIGVEPLAKFLKIPVEKTTKTILFENEKSEVIVAVVRGDYDVNENKLLEISNSKELKLATEETVKKVTKAEVGYAGILNLSSNLKVYIDESVANRKNFECGANKTNYHTINVNFGRDLPEPKEYYDIKIAKEGDLFPETGEVYETKKAIEVGNIFLLKTKFTDAFNMKYLDEDGKQKPVFMGCYGIGPSRLLGTLVEVFNDDKGIIWPEEVAPFRYHLINLSTDKKVKEQAEDIYNKLIEAKKEVFFDDREEVSPGEKFKDADLIGIPYRLIVSDKTKGDIEIKHRKEESSKNISLKELLNDI